MVRALSVVQRPVVMMLSVILALGVIASVVLVPRVAGQNPRTVVVDVVFEPQRVIPVVDGQPGRGDIWSGGGTIYDGDLDADEPIGEFYFFGVVTGNRWDENAANHLFEVGRFELWGQGSLDVMGTANFDAASYLSIVGGTGSFATARGQCTEEMVGPRRGRFTCEII